MHAEIFAETVEHREERPRTRMHQDLSEDVRTIEVGAIRED
jgi:hypothetical protein